MNCNLCMYDSGSFSEFSKLYWNSFWNQNVVLESFWSSWMFIAVRVQCLDTKKTFSQENLVRISQKIALGFLWDSWFFRNSRFYQTDFLLSDGPKFQGLMGLGRWLHSFHIRALKELIRSVVSNKCVYEHDPASDSCST